MTKEEIYAQMSGTSESYISDEFQPGGACYDYYSKVYEARERLAERTGIDFEDADIMEIIVNMEEIAKICSYKMFDYGVMNANNRLYETLSKMQTKQAEIEAKEKLENDGNERDEKQKLAF